MSQRPHKKQGGWLTVEALLAIALLIGAGTLLQGLYAAQQTERSTTLAADHLATVNHALTQYAKANWKDYEAVINATTAVRIDPSLLYAGGYLTPGFSLINPYGQTYELALLGTPATGVVSLVLGSGGRPGAGTLTGADLRLATQVLPAVAEKVGAAGGLIPYQGLPGAAPNVIEGLGGAWRLNLAGVSGLSGITLNGGSLAAVSFFLDGVVNNDYLHRHDLGVPSLNTMRTHIDMDGNDITQAKSLTDMSGFIHTQGDSLTAAASGSAVNAWVADRGSIELRDGIVKAADVYIDDTRVAGAAVPMSSGIYDVRRLRPNNTVPKPACPGTMTSSILLSTESAPVGQTMTVQTVSHGIQSGHVLSYTSRAVDLGSSWRAILEIRMQGNSTGTQTYQLAEGEGRLVAFLKCR